MREVSISFSNENGDGASLFLVDVGGMLEFNGPADRLAIKRALEEFDKRHAACAITCITVRASASAVLKP